MEVSSHVLGHKIKFKQLSLQRFREGSTGDRVGRGELDFNKQSKRKGGEENEIVQGCGKRIIKGSEKVGKTAFIN